jgi:hypothetical protein
MLHQALLLAPPAASTPITITLSGEMVAGITIGATAGCLVLLLSICALGYWCCRRHRDHEEIVHRLRADLRRMKLGKQRGCGRSSSSTSVHGLLSPSRTPSPTASPQMDQASASSPVPAVPALSKAEVAELERKRVAAAAAAAAAEREVVAREQHAIAKEEAALLAAEEAELAAEEAALEAEIAASARAALTAGGPAVGYLPFGDSRAAVRFPVPPVVPGPTQPLEANPRLHHARGPHMAGQAVASAQRSPSSSFAPGGQVAPSHRHSLPTQPWGFPQMQQRSNVGTIRTKVYR